MWRLGSDMSKLCLAWHVMVTGESLLGTLQSLLMWGRSEDWSNVFYNEQWVESMLRAAMSVVQIETSRSATAWATGCVWTAHLWPELLCPAWHLIHLKPITRLLLWSPSRKWQWSSWQREEDSRTSPQLWSSPCVSLADLDLILSLPRCRYLH